MGYRVRLGKIAKSEQDKYRGKTHDECLSMMSDDEALYRPNAHTQLYEIGKTMAYENEHLQPFYDFDIREAEESDFRILSRDGLIELIKAYEAEIAAYYKEIFDSVVTNQSKDDPNDILRLPEGEMGRLLAMVHGKRHDWFNGFCSIIQYDEGGDGEMTNSWRLEYAIFNLVFILKTFDFENDYLIYSGW